MKFSFNGSLLINDKGCLLGTYLFLKTFPKYYIPQTACTYMQHITQMYYLQMRPLVNEDVITLFPSTAYQNDANKFVDKRTCCEDWMPKQFRSSICSKYSTTSHIKSSGTQPKVTLLTCLGSRLPAERQIGKRAITCVFQCQMYTHLKSQPCRSQLFTNGIYI